MHADSIDFDAITEFVIGRALVVSNTLRTGFLEKIYENALAHELRKAGFEIKQQHNMSVYYDRVVVGTYTADLLIENAVLVELKAVRALDSIHKTQCLNYLKATGLPLCLLINFGNPRLEIKRVVNNL
jgi:GxxExxY protein